MLLTALALAALIAVATVAGILLGRGGEPSGTAIRAADVAPAGEAGAASLGSVPTQTFHRFDGSVGSFADYRGKPLVVNFFASWCQPCLRELPGFAKLHRQLGGTVAFLGLNLQDDPAAGRAIIEQTGVDYDVASDPDGTLFLAFGGFAMPTTVFVAPDGTILEVFSGELTAEQLETKVEQYFDV